MRVIRFTLHPRQKNAGILLRAYPTKEEAEIFFNEQEEKNNEKRK